MSFEDDEKILALKQGQEWPDQRYIVERKAGIVSVRPADDEPVPVLFTKEALDALDLQVEKAVERILSTSVATAELNPDFWQRLQQIIKPPDITIHNHPAPVQVTLVDPPAQEQGEEDY